MKDLFISILMISFISGCGSARHKSTSGNYMASDDYQSRDSLKESLFNEKGGGLSEVAIQKILKSKVRLPRKTRLGVIKIERVSNAFMENKSFVLNEKLATQFFGKINSSGRVRDITVLPSMMIPAPLTVAALRESAVRLQVDMLLVLRSDNASTIRYMPFWIKDKAKTLSTVEAVLLDVRTGIIPFTAIATDTALLRTSDEDLNRHELIMRSSEEAETKALSKIADDLKSFLKRVP